MTPPVLVAPTTDRTVSSRRVWWLAFRRWGFNDAQARGLAEAAYGFVRMPGRGETT